MTRDHLSRAGRRMMLARWRKRRWPPTPPAIFRARERGGRILF